MDIKEIKKIMAEHWLATKNYNGEITVSVFEQHDNRTNFRVDTEGNEFEVCAYTDGMVFMRLWGVTNGSGGWATLNGQPALIMDDRPFLLFD